MRFTKFKKKQINEELCMSTEYNFRESHVYYDDTKNKDEWQNEVYSKAKEVFLANNFSSVFDFGCGSGYKLFKYFGDSNYKLTLYDFSNTIDLVKEKYKIYENNCSYLSVESGFLKKINCDMLIVSDVIEHVLFPDELLNIMLNSINFKYLVLSTPDRDLLYKKDSDYFNGPPRNIHHIREWSFDEIKKYMLKYFNEDEILEHYISSKEQATQVFVVKKL